MDPEVIKDKIKKHANKQNRLFQDELTIYGLERTLFRLSKSKYVDNFVLKGGILLYAIYGGNYVRTTSDIDFLCCNVNNEVANIEKIMKDIFSVQIDDGLQYDIDSLAIKEITELKKYHGLKVTIKAYLNRTKVNVSIDIGFDDIVYPKRVEMDFPVLLNMEYPRIYAYSIESVIAEKFEAFVQLGYGNSRYKDFYDIYILASSYNFDGSYLKQAVFETFQHRRTGFHDIVAFDEEFKMDPIRNIRWTSFVKKKKAMEVVDFKTLMDTLVQFLYPVKEAIIEGIDFTLLWDYKNKRWE